MLISLPSGHEIHELVAEKCKKWLSEQKITVVIGFSLHHRKLFQELYLSKYNKHFRVNDFCYDIINNKYIDMHITKHGRVWGCLVLSNMQEFSESDFNFAKESPFENSVKCKKIEQEIIKEFKVI